MFKKNFICFVLSSVLISFVDVLCQILAWDEISPLRFFESFFFNLSRIGWVPEFILPMFISTKNILAWFVLFISVILLCIITWRTKITRLIQFKPFIYSFSCIAAIIYVIPTCLTVTTGAILLSIEYIPILSMRLLVYAIVSFMTMIAYLVFDCRRDCYRLIRCGRNNPQRFLSISNRLYYLLTALLIPTFLLFFYSDYSDTISHRTIVTMVFTAVYTVLSLLRTAYQASLFRVDLSLVLGKLPVLVVFPVYLIELIIMTCFIAINYFCIFIIFNAVFLFVLAQLCRKRLESVRLTKQQSPAA